MYCPNCGKMLELTERNFCTGCGEKVDLALLDKTREKFAKDPGRTKASLVMPYGARYISSDTEMAALGKGLAIRGGLGFVGFFLLAKFTFLVVNWGAVFGWGLIGIVPTGLLGIIIVSKLSPNAKAVIARSFNFIKTEGVIYHMVDFLVMKMPFLKKK